MLVSILFEVIVVIFCDYKGLSDKFHCVIAVLILKIFKINDSNRKHRVFS